MSNQLASNEKGSDESESSKKNMGLRPRNTERSYGWVAILLHWLDVLVIFSLFAVGWYMVELTYYDALYKPLPFIHQSVGILLAGWFVFRVAWRLANPSPEPEPGISAVQNLAAKVAHIGLYLMIAIVLLSGYLIPTAEGVAVSVFDIFSVPATITSLPTQADNAGWVHRYVAYALVGLASLHAAAALKHHFINRDNTLRRMLGRSDTSPDQ